MHSFIINSHEVFIHIHQGCFAGTGAIVRLPQCQWSKPDGYGKISKCITTTKQKPCAYFLEYTVFMRKTKTKTVLEFEGDMSYVTSYTTQCPPPPKKKKKKQKKNILATIHLWPQLIQCAFAIRVNQNEVCIIALNQMIILYYQHHLAFHRTYIIIMYARVYTSVQTQTIPW